MSDHAQGDTADRSDEGHSDPGQSQAVEATETYRTDDGTVFYDAENPLAWLQIDDPLSLREWT